jgi:hypothetical protein
MSVVCGQVESLRRTYHSSRGVLPTVVRNCVWSINLKEEDTIIPVGSQRHKKNCFICKPVFVTLCITIYYNVQDYQKVSVRLMITVQKTCRYFKQFQSLGMKTCLELGITDGVSVSLVSSKTQFGVSKNVWRLAGNTSNITCNYLYCNHQVHKDFLSFCMYSDSNCNTHEIVIYVT